MRIKEHEGQIGRGGMFIGISCIILAAIAAAVISYLILKSPFGAYPYFREEIDVSGKRKPNVEDLIDEYLIEYGMGEIEKEKSQIAAWKRECQKLIMDSSRLKERRERQFKSLIDDDRAYRFVLFRVQTRYQQRNYERTPYKVKNEVDSYACSYEYLEKRNEMLSGINYETTLRKYNSKEQRKLLTPKLREQIMERDNYTCQICGKYMPDGVGLQIDHIIPIAKGGKTVPSNLQVLCSKCNERKHDKLEY